MHSIRRIDGVSLVFFSIIVFDNGFLVKMLGLIQTSELLGEEYYSSLLIGNSQNDQHQQGQPIRLGRGQQGGSQQKSSNTICQGFDAEFLAEAFNIDQETGEQTTDRGSNWEWNRKEEQKQDQGGWKKKEGWVAKRDHPARPVGGPNDGPRPGGPFTTPKQRPKIFRVDEQEIINEIKVHKNILRDTSVAVLCTLDYISRSQLRTHFELRETGILGRVTLDGLDHGTVDLLRAQWSYKVFVLEKADIKSVMEGRRSNRQNRKQAANLLHQSGNADTKVEEEKVMNECKKASDDEDTSKGALVDWPVRSDDMKSREVLDTVKLDLNNVFASYVC
ncbi:nuclear RNA polymerase D1B [Tanacetum coccineum]|uniref:Nuclear RNA polymerase D1B n=1 Tax=Tanacetum coccineum TaxID=301880 RepID=A0ABQ5E669_9ASTR